MIIINLVRKSYRVSINVVVFLFFVLYANSVAVASVNQASLQDTMESFKINTPGKDKFIDYIYYISRI